MAFWYFMAGWMLLCTLLVVGSLKMVHQYREWKWDALQERKLRLKMEKKRLKEEEAHLLAKGGEEDEDK